MADQLQKQKEQQKIYYETPELKTVDDVSKYMENANSANVSLGEKRYEVYYESEKQQEETEALLNSDQSLENYYENHDATMLQGLRSKSFINFPGKKAERKRLREAHIKRISMETRKQAMIDRFRKEHEENKMTDEEILEKTSVESRESIRQYLQYISAYEGYDEEKIQGIMNKVDNMGVVQKAHYAELMQKHMERKVNARRNSTGFRQIEIYCEVMGLQKEAREEMEKEFLYKTKKKDVKGFVNKLESDEAYQKRLKELLDRDMTGDDTEEIRRLQTMYIHLWNPGKDYQAYRLLRRIKQHEETKVVPDFVYQTKKYSKGEIERTCARFMKPVNYKEENGKQVPATEQDQKNLEFNIKWGESLLSDKEEDWTFRFQEMEKAIITIFDELKPMMERVIANGTLSPEDEAQILKDAEKCTDQGGVVLCLSGVQNLKEQNSLFYSSYMKSLPKERQKELDKKSDVISSFAAVRGQVFIKYGANPEKNTYSTEDVVERVPSVISVYLEDLKMKYAALKE